MRHQNAYVYAKSIHAQKQRLCISGKQNRISPAISWYEAEREAFCHSGILIRSSGLVPYTANAHNHPASRSQINGVKRQASS